MRSDGALEDGPAPLPVNGATAIQLMPVVVPSRELPGWVITQLARVEDQA
jgi:hypothetical protein